MDVAPVGTPNGQTVVLLHGGSYYGWYWKSQIEALTKAGFRVVVEDRLGWGKSSKADPSLQHQPSRLEHGVAARSSEHHGGGDRRPLHRRADGDALRVPLPEADDAPGDDQPDRAH